MAGTRPAYLTFEEYHAEPTNNPFGLSEGDIVSGIAGIYSGWIVTSRTPNIKEVHLKILADFTSPVGAVGVFVQGAGSTTGLLQVIHGRQKFFGPARETFRGTKAHFCIFGRGGRHQWGHHRLQ
jgi:hypothetical protein